MKFVKFPSRGGDYLVVAGQIAYLRKHEDGQTKIGMVGGDSLLVAGSLEKSAVVVTPTPVGTFAVTVAPSIAAVVVSAIFVADGFAISSRHYRPPFPWESGHWAHGDPTGGNHGRSGPGMSLGVPPHPTSAWRVEFSRSA